ncbi:MAG: hypothetical protein E6Q97_28460 [Desulfurellales bacterium]|nr:MAG: hypothetical protein E6Q97_28460 [Desulfurellales bacterium]
MIYIGIDPGASGAIAAICPLGPDWIKLCETEHDVSNWLRDISSFDCRAIIEQVQPMPRAVCGNVPMFKLGCSYGFLRGLLTGYGIKYEAARPQKWQKAMGCLTKGDKNVSKAAAQRLFPDIKITHANADALLIAEYCRRTWV